MNSVLLALLGNCCIRGGFFICIYVLRYQVKFVSYNDESVIRRLVEIATGSIDRNSFLEPLGDIDKTMDYRSIESMGLLFSYHGICCYC